MLTAMFVLVQVPSTRAADPNPAEEEAIAAAIRAGGTADIDTELEDAARVAVKLKATGDAELAFLAKFPAVGAITVIDASRCTPRAWAALTRLTNLQQLTLGNSTATDQSAALFAKMANLRVLYLGQSRITDAGLVRLSKLPELRVLDVYDTKVTDRGVAELTKMEKLEQLNLSGTRVTNKGVFTLKEVKTLKLLRVNRTNVTEQGITAIETERPDLTVRY